MKNLKEYSDKDAFLDQLKLAQLKSIRIAKKTNTDDYVSSFKIDVHRSISRDSIKDLISDLALR